MSWVDNFDGERVHVENCTDEELESILSQTDRYYPADKSTGMDYGIGYWQSMREQARDLQDEIDWRATQARQEDAIEMRDDDERLGPASE